MQIYRCFLFLCTLPLDLFKPSYIEPLNTSLLSPLTQVDILRDDQIHPIVSGNKWRKLKYVLSDMMLSGKDTLVTFGGAYSNHVVAAAYACRAFGFKSHAFIRGDEARDANSYEKLCIEQGMKLQHVSREAYRQKKELFGTFFGNEARAYFLDEGGKHPLGLKGCGEILDETGKEYDYIVLPAGTGTTLEGLVAELARRGLKTKALGISALKNNFELDTSLEKYDQRYWQVFHDFHRGRYAKSDPELIQYIMDFHRETGIITEAVYTGKMLMALRELGNSGVIGPRKSVLVIHTGGLLNFPGKAAGD